MSTVEAEYIALCLATQEVAWIRQLLDELDQKPVNPITMNEDNQGAISVAHNLVNHKRTKHIDIKFHYVREAVLNNVIELVYCPTKEMLADVFTKAITKDQIEYLHNMMGLKVIK